MEQEDHKAASIDVIADDEEKTYAQLDGSVLARVAILRR